MGRKLESTTGVRLNTKNFIKTDSNAIVSADYFPRTKVLELEWRGEDGDHHIYHYLNVDKSVYNKISKLNKLRESKSNLAEVQLEGEYSIGKFANQEVKPLYDYYELLVLNETA